MIKINVREKEKQYVLEPQKRKKTHGNPFLVINKNDSFFIVTCRFFPL